MSNKHKFIIFLALFLVSAPILPSDTDANFYGLEPPEFPSWLDDDQYMDDREVLKDIWNTMIQDFCRYGWDCLLHEREEAGNGTPDRYKFGPNCIDAANRFVEDFKGGLPTGWSIFKVGALSRGDYNDNDGRLGSCHSASVIRSPGNRY
ncbi:MAG: hypothetical protein FJZ87_16720 [Chloroflexi bacterium]|nr:hypothetical protein [Chloroflexota bacterium]